MSGFEPSEFPNFTPEGTLVWFRTVFHQTKNTIRLRWFRWMSIELNEVQGIVIGLIWFSIASCIQSHETRGQSDQINVNLASTSRRFIPCVPTVLGLFNLIFGFIHCMRREHFKRVFQFRLGSVEISTMFFQFAQAVWKFQLGLSISRRRRGNLRWFINFD